MPWRTRAALVSAAAGAAVTAVALSSSITVKCESPKDSRSVTLRDGRRLAYRVHGQGVPVFALHGMESSSDTWDTMLWADSQSLAQLYPGVQVIAIDRPGYGDSTSPPQGYSYKVFADDLAQLADALKLSRFCVAGHSSGGPCALAAAAFLPTRVVACAAISSDAPYVHPKADPELTRKGCEMECDALIRSGYFGGGKSDRHAWKQGPLGFVADYVLERMEWPFALEEIALGPRLTIWYGSKDIECIVLSGKFLHELIPGSKLREQARAHGFKKDLDGNVQTAHLAEIFTELELQWGLAA